MACTSAWLGGRSYLGNYPSPTWESSTASPIAGYGYSNNEFYNTAAVQLSAQQLNTASSGAARQSASPKSANKPKKLVAPPAKKLEDIIDCAPAEMSPLKKDPENCHSAVLHSYDMNTQQWSKKTTRVVLDMKKPINEGSCRYVYRMSDMDNGTFVLKVSKDDRDSRDSYFNEVAWLSMCLWYADKFTDTLRAAIKKKSDSADSPLSTIPANVRAKYVTAYVVEVPSLPGPHGYLIATAEPLLSGHFRKYTNNFGFVHPKAHSLPLAFSHFTYEASNQQILVCDIQGVRPDDDTDMFTDPQILSNSPNGIIYGKCDMGEKGIRAFFESHVCNEMCAACNLPRRGKATAPAPALVPIASPRKNTSPAAAQAQQASPQPAPRPEQVQVQQIQQIQPVQAVQPVQPVQPVPQVQPVQPVKPVLSVQPVQQVAKPKEEVKKISSYHHQRPHADPAQRKASMAQEITAKLAQALTALPPQLLTQQPFVDPFANIGELPTKRSKDKKQKRDKNEKREKSPTSPELVLEKTIEAKRVGSFLKEAFTAAVEAKEGKDQCVKEMKEIESKEALDRSPAHKHDIKHMLKGLQRPDQGSFLISSMFNSQDHAVVSMYNEPSKDKESVPQTLEPPTSPAAKPSTPTTPVLSTTSSPHVTPAKPPTSPNMQPLGKPPMVPVPASASGTPSTPSSTASTVFPSEKSTVQATGSSTTSTSSSLSNINGVIVNGGNSNNSSMSGTPTTAPSTAASIPSSAMIGATQPSSPEAKQQLDWVNLSPPFPQTEAVRPITSPTRRAPSPQAESVPNVGAEDDAEFERRLKKERKERRAKDKARREARESQEGKSMKEHRQKKKEKTSAAKPPVAVPHVQPVVTAMPRSGSFTQYTTLPIQTQPLHRSSSFGNAAFSGQFGQYGHVSMGGMPSNMYYPHGHGMGSFPPQYQLNNMGFRM